jgi:hypothetical protein
MPLVQEGFSLLQGAESGLHANSHPKNIGVNGSSLGLNDNL